MKKFGFILVLILFSCQEKNQYINTGKNLKAKTGKWVEEDPYPEGLYISKGKYKNGIKVGVWKTKFNSKLYQKDKINDSIINTKIYHSNGKIAKKGSSKILLNPNSFHWYMNGVWKEYDDKGKLILIQNYREMANKIDTIDCLKTDCYKY